jgi:hypothetical protein
LFFLTNGKSKHHFSKYKEVLVASFWFLVLSAFWISIIWGAALTVPSGHRAVHCKSVHAQSHLTSGFPLPSLPHASTKFIILIFIPCLDSHYPLHGSCPHEPFIFVVLALVLGFQKTRN